MKKKANKFEDSTQRCNKCNSVISGNECQKCGYKASDISLMSEEDVYDVPKNLVKVVDKTKYINKTHTAHNTTYDSIVSSIFGEYMGVNVVYSEDQDTDESNTKEVYIIDDIEMID